MLSELIQSMNELKLALKEQNSMNLKKVANQAIKRAAMRNDYLWAEISLVAYALHKLASKEHIISSEKWQEVKKQIIISLQECITALKKKDIKGFEEKLQNITKSISSVDTKLGNFALNVYDKARIKMASSAYGFGLSLTQAAALTKADEQETLSYIGHTKMHDEEGITFGIGPRLKKLKKFLGESQ